MKLRDLLSDCKYTVVQGDVNVDIESLAYDSRKVDKASMFICITGKSLDGHRFLDKAIESGAAAILVEKDVEVSDKRIAVIKVHNSREIMSHLADRFYNEPSKDINMIGITGTNGKTSISFLVSEILQYVQRTVGVIGTIGIQVNNKTLDIEKTTPTTPDSLEMQMILNEMKRQEVSDVVMEVTSIAIDLNRVDHCGFNIGIFTNLTEDHLDYHETMENYKNAKKKLFNMCETGIVNVDDPVGLEISETADATIITYAIDSKADIQAQNVQFTPTGSSFDLVLSDKVYHIKINLPGKFNVYNALAAISTALKLGVSIVDIKEALKGIRGAKGRFESVLSNRGFTAVVDYAHTPDALMNVLKTARQFNPNKIITVFGCGGDRDKTKRPIMGEISGELSDFTVITSDNPRTENPEQILKDIEQGVKRNTQQYTMIADRKGAIKEAISMASIGDIVIIAGKGHETYQVFNDQTIHFDDMEVVLEFLS
ncbi:UDP-N-acetylmuramoyl-L-alanyl-D-glutamate--2,6-diaminopimelate ligase [Bacillus sp. Brlt_9]|uniref:UDP-N-acetylmuramoyl-L-alanyl-D-glutamate--2, 6-diaminopimelate ligase n=1 Tax=Bacillus sp. Brlt_9 TaxID=3110916 RepID=UPI003F7C1EBA